MMRYLWPFARVAMGVLFVLHGIAHLPGLLGSWKLTTFEDVSYQPNILLTQASDGVVFLLGVIFLAAGASFVVAGVAVIQRLVWWPQAAGFAVLISLIVTTLWRQDAIVGLVLNILVVGVIVAVWAWTKRASTRLQPVVR